MNAVAQKKTATAFSYIRFSHPDQAKGDSLRRQTEAAAAWCERNGVGLDATTTLRDLGRSAYTGTHRTNDRRALALFLRLVEDGKVPRGSYLIIENLDRLSREEIQPALLLALNLLQAGVRIVQLKPVEMIFDDKSDTLPVMMMMMELSRGHGESAMKSERNGKAWAEKKKAAREGGEVMTHRLPAWVEERGGKLFLIRAATTAVKRVFKLAAAGYGQSRIVRKLTADKVPAIGPSGRWVRTYVFMLLTDRRVLGEHQPRRGRSGEADGPSIPNYYPAAITQDEWDAASAARSGRRLDTAPPRQGKTLNLFAGLLRDARDGATYYVDTRVDRDGGRARVLRNNRASSTAALASPTFDFNTFESAILSLLREVNPQEITGHVNESPDEVMVLSGELARVEASIAALEADLNEHGESPVLFRRLRGKEEEKRDLVARLTESRQKAAHPLSEAWGEAHSLLEVLELAPDQADARLRLRAALRRIIESIWLLVIPCGRERQCVAQIWFTGGETHRDYLITHWPAKANASARQEGGWTARSFSSADVGPGQLFDLRRREDAAELEAGLLAVKLGGTEEK